MKKLFPLAFCALSAVLNANAQTENTCCKNTATCCKNTTSCCDSTQCAEPATNIFTGDFTNDETGFRLHLNLDEEAIEIPGMSFLGLTNGYLDGKTNNHVYSVWMLLKYEMNADGRKVKLRFSNDIGSDSQDVELTLIDDDTIKYEALGINSIRKVEGGKKLVKTPSSMILNRKKK